MKLFKSVFLAIAAFVASVAFNSAAGAALASVAGFSPAVGIIGGNVAGFLLGALPKGCACATVFTEVWTGEMVKAFRTAADNLGWYDRIKSYDQYVDNDVIHFTELGGDPEVLVNNTTYPLDIETLTDADKPISLDHFDTTATPVTDDELHACSYDKMASVQERHREALKEKVRQKAIHAIAPAENKTESPVLLTTGADDGTRKKFIAADLLALKKSFDKMRVPKKTAYWLCAATTSTTCWRLSRSSKTTTTSIRPRAKSAVCTASTSMSTTVRRIITLPRRRNSLGVRPLPTPTCRHPWRSMSVA